MGTFFSQERQLARASAPPADNTTLEALPCRKWMKILLYFFFTVKQAPFILHHESFPAFLQLFVQKSPCGSAGRGPRPEGSIGLNRQMAHI